MDGSDLRPPPLFFYLRIPRMYRPGLDRHSLRTWGPQALYYYLIVVSGCGVCRGTSHFVGEEKKAYR